jgi:tetratricopeptide (TPR) repeat protein
MTMPKKARIQKQLDQQAEQARNLNIEISFLEGLLKRDPDYVDALRILGDDYTRRGRYQDGLQIDLRLVRLCHDDALVHYNLACSLSLTEQLDLAAAELDRAITLGYRDFSWLNRDPDLKKLRRHPLFKKIRDRLKAMMIEIR